MRATRIFETVLYGEDVESLREFYVNVMGLELLERFGELGLALRCGSGVLLLFDPRLSADGSRNVPAHGAQGEGHIAFAVRPAELQSWRDHLERHDVPLEREVEWSSGGRSIYVRDPAGNSVELAPPHLWGMPAGE